jgi:hypothetical protein
MGVTSHPQYCVAYSDVPTPMRCSPACCMRPNLPATSISTAMSASKTGGSQAVTAWRGSRSPSGCTRGTLKIEYQATALSEYALQLSPDHQRIEAVKNPRRIETHFLEGATALVADLRDRMATRVAPPRPGTASFAGQDRRAGKATSAPVLSRNRRAAPRCARSSKEGSPLFPCH